MAARIASISKRVLRWLVAIIGTLLFAVTLVLALVVLTLNLGPSRSFVRARVNAALHGSFAGEVIVDRIGSLSLGSLGGVDAHVLDAKGRRVIVLEGLTVQSRWGNIVLDLLQNRPLVIRLEPLRADHVELTLIDDGQGSPTLASAFSPRQSKPKPKTKDEGPPPTIVLPRVRVRHVWVHGALSQQLIDAEIQGLVTSLESKPNELLIDLSGAKLITRGLPARLNPSGDLAAKLRLPSAPGARPDGKVEFRGTLIGAPATLHAELKAEKLAARLSAANIPASAVREQVPSLTVDGPTALDLRIQGELPQLTLSGEIKNGGAVLAVQGEANLSETKRGRVELRASGVNLKALMATAPQTSLDATATASVLAESTGALSGQYRLELGPGRVNEVPTPVIRASGDLTRSADGRLGLTGQLRVDEPGALTVVDYTLSTTDQREQLARAKLTMKVDQPPRAKALLGLTASGELSAEAEVNLTRSRLSARAAADLGPVVMPDRRVQRMRVEAVARGSLTAPELTVTSTLTGVTVSGQELPKVQVQAAGTPERLRVSAHVERGRQQIELRAVVSNKTNLVISEPNLVLTSPNGELTARARAVSAAGGRVYLDQLELAGPGAVKATGSVGAGRADLNFALIDLDLGRLASILGVESPLRRGIVSAEGHVTGPLGRLRGEVRARARSLDFEDIRDGNANLELALTDKIVSGTLETKLGRSTVSAQISDLDLPAPGASTAALLKLRGAIAITGRIELARIAPMLRAAGVPIEQARGQLDLEARIDNLRSGPGNPILFVRLKTRALKFVEQREKRESIESASAARQAQPFALEGVDGDLAILLDTGSHQARVDGSFYDRFGPMALVTIESKLPELGTAELPAALRDLPLRATLEVPQRELERLPAVVRPKAIQGVLAANFEGQGSLKDPRFKLAVDVRRLKSRDDKRGLDCSARVSYDRNGGEMVVTADGRRGRVGDLSSKWRGNLLGRLTAKSSQMSPFTLDADLKLDRFPIGVVPELSDRNIRGPLSGNLKLRGLGQDAHLQAEFDGSGLSVGQARLSGLKAELQDRGGALLAKLEAQQPKGGMQAEFSAPLTWGDRMVPIVDPHAKAKLHAQKFQIEALSPLLLSYVSAVEGELNADLSVELGEGAPRLQGTAEVDKGVVQIPQIGQRFSDVRAKVSIQNDEIRLESMQARGLSGRVTAKASARLAGTDLQSANAKVDIKPNEKLPITFEGVEIGDAFGHIELNYAKKEGGTEIRVNVPSFRLIMPESPMNNVQSLSPDEHVRVGVYREDGKFATLPVQPLEGSGKQATADAVPTQTRVRIQLGDSVWIERGQQATVQLAGELTLISGQQTRIEGRIDLKGGTLDVNGKTFNIEHGTVGFGGDDPSDPTITATARWDATGYTVYADYAGTVKNGKLTLHSEPQLTQNEIISLLLFGTPEGQLGANDNGGGAAATALGVAGGTAVKGFNRAMSDFTHLDVSARIDTSTGSARPEIVVQVTPRLTTRVSRALGEPAPGQSPDRTFLTLELRLKQSWALSTVIGDRGASTVDLIWRKRY